MEFDSIKHHGVNPNLFDIDKCYEIYDQDITPTWPILVKKSTTLYYKINSFSHFTFIHYNFPHSKLFIS